MAAVLVHIDLEAGRPGPSSLVALAAGRAAASSWGGVLYAVAIVDGTAPPFGGAAGRAQVPAVGTAPPFGGAAGRAQVPAVDGTAPPFGGAVGRAQVPAVDGTAPPFGGAAGRAQVPAVDGTAPPFGGAAGRAQVPAVDGTAPPFGGAAGRAQVPAVDGTAPPFGGAAGRAQVPAVEAPARQLDSLAAALARGGADRILIATTKAPPAPLWAVVGGAWQAVLDQLRPRLVLFGADAPSAPELGPRTAARIGARLLVRATAHGIEDVELRDRDGAHARASESGAAVVLVGRAPATAPADDRVAAVVLLPAEVDPRVEIVAATPAEVAHTPGVVIALGDDVAGDPKAVADARRLAALVGGQLVGNSVAARTGAVASGAAVDRTTPLAPELCVVVGNAELDLAGGTSVVKIGAPPSKLVDGALPGSPIGGLADIVTQLERIAGAHGP